MWPYFVFAAFLLCVSALLLWIHRQAWRVCQSEGLEEHAFDFRYRQYRRRMQASAMIGIVGALVIVSLAVPEPVPNAVLWLVVISLVLWMLVLAFADMVSSYFYYAQVRAQHMAEHATLQAQVDKIRRREGNGQAHE